MRFFLDSVLPVVLTLLLLIAVWSGCVWLWRGQQAAEAARRNAPNLSLSLSLSQRVSHPTWTTPRLELGRRLWIFLLNDNKSVYATRTDQAKSSGLLSSTLDRENFWHSHHCTPKESLSKQTIDVHRRRRRRRRRSNVDSLPTFFATVVVARQRRCNNHVVGVGVTKRKLIGTTTAGNGWNGWNGWNVFSSDANLTRWQPKHLVLFNGALEGAPQPKRFICSKSLS